MTDEKSEKSEMAKHLEGMAGDQLSTLGEMVDAERARRRNDFGRVGQMGDAEFNDFAERVNAAGDRAKRTAGEQSAHEQVAVQNRNKFGGGIG